MILEGIKSQYEKHHKVTYTPEALSSAVKLSVKFMQDRKLPDKAIDLIDQSGALQHTAPPELRKSVIDVTEIETALAGMVKIPVKKVSDEEKQKLSELSGELHSAIYGQNEAVELVSDTILVSSAKLGNPNKPIGSFLFVGPTGVGKTELVKQLAEKMHMPMFRFDMSEYKEPHKISLLLGSPPGYVGSDKGGDLTEKVHKNPHCVVLLDEIEKAHSSIFDTFLQVMDNGRLTDSQGREIDFRHVVFIMTSNAGSSQIAENKPGFVSGASSVNADIMKGVKDTFRPEFINRLDAVVPFKQLGREHISKVAKKFLMALSGDLLEHHALEMDFDETVIEWFSNEGYDIVMGARPMERAIRNNLTKPLSKQLLSFNKEDKAALEKVVVRIKDNAVDIQLV
jgi:ATP-dependent Clp protease ATP-binding subunit ClpA